MSILRGLIGLVVLVGIAWCVSSNRKRTPWKLIGIAIGMQIVLGMFLIQWDLGNDMVQAMSDGMTRLLSFSQKGAEFVFGDVENFPGGKPGLAFRSLPTIIFFSCLMAILYHLGIMQLVVWLMAQVMTRLLRVSGAEAMAMAANVFVGQTEAPLVVRRFLPKMTTSEINSLMTGGFATVAGSVLAAYIGFFSDAGGTEYIPHLLIASVMSAPAAFAISKIILPETEPTQTGQTMSLKTEKTAGNLLDAATTGVTEGLSLYLNVVAMLLAFVALVHLVDWPLEAIGNRFEIEGGLSLSRLFGWVFAPISYAMGVAWEDATRFGALLGTKIGLNEFMAFLELQQEITYNLHPEQMEGKGVTHAMSKKSLFMATYALCGFANFASVGIQIGGIAPIIPERRKEIIKLAMKAMIGGALASWMTATIAGMFFSA